MSFAARLTRLERLTVVARGTIELHFTAAGAEGRQTATPCSEPSHGPSCAYYTHPIPSPVRFVRTYVGVGLPG
jgi:hypothetical protein